MTAPPVLETLAVLTLLCGAALFCRSLWRLGAALRARRTRGAPYARGQITDRAISLAMTVPVAPAGALALLLALAQGAFQPTAPGDVVRVGRVEAHRAGWARTTVVLTPDPAYPEGRVLQGEIEGARWAISGDFLDWAPGVRWLGLRPAQRVRALLGSADPGGMASGPGAVTVIDAPPRAAVLLLRWARWLPFLTVRRGASSWFAPADRTVGILYATPEGYIADAAASTGGER
jgi:hypothetical protein